MRFYIELNLYENTKQKYMLKSESFSKFKEIFDKIEDYTKSYSDTCKHQDPDEFRFLFQNFNENVKNEIKNKIVEQMDFHFAIETGDYDLVEFLVTEMKNKNPRMKFSLDGFENKDKDDDKVKFYYTPLYICTIFNYKIGEYYKILKLLVEQGATLCENYTDRNMNPMVVAIQNNYFEMTKCLIDNNMSITPYALEVACMKIGLTDTKFVKLLLENGIDSATVDDRIMMFSCSKGNMEVVKCLVNHGVFISDNAIYTAIVNNHSCIVEFLLSKSKNIDLSKKTFLTDSVRSGNTKMVNILLENCRNNMIDINENNGLPLQLATNQNRLDIINLLVKNDVDVNKNNGAALSCASANGNLDIVKCLLNAGADSKCDSEHALFNAMHKGHFDIYKLLKQQLNN